MDMLMKPIGSPPFALSLGNTSGIEPLAIDQCQTCKVGFGVLNLGGSEQLLSY